jgi:hypothetical protein
MTPNYYEPLLKTELFQKENLKANMYLDQGERMGHAGSDTMKKFTENIRS